MRLSFSDFNRSINCSPSPEEDLERIIRAVGGASSNNSMYAPDSPLQTATGIDPDSTTGSSTSRSRSPARVFKTLRESASQSVLKPASEGVKQPSLSNRKL
ncbi:hypothetical protein AB6A40_011655 [Gnathostoma spinigerum]|uniref:Uncharacterized protein n=1 Tax=Gnathostoma spinigerum TaxID=75299 RepID=A0ABD6EZQ3_9BILA